MPFTTQNLINAQTLNSLVGKSPGTLTQFLFPLGHNVAPSATIFPAPINLTSYAFNAGARISTNCAITAWHIIATGTTFQAAGQTQIFNDGTTSHIMTIANGVQVGSTDIGIVSYTTAFPAGIAISKILPDTFFDNMTFQAVYPDNEMAFLVAHADETITLAMIQVQPSTVINWSAGGNTTVASFYTSPIANDSGHGPESGHVLGPVINGELVLDTHFQTANSGPSYNKNLAGIQSAVTSLAPGDTISIWSAAAMPTTIQDVLFSNFGTSANLIGTGTNNHFTDAITGMSPRLNGSGWVQGQPGSVDGGNGSDCEDAGYYTSPAIDWSRDFVKTYTIRNDTGNAGGGFNLALDEVLLVIGDIAGKNVTLTVDFGSGNNADANHVAFQLMDIAQNTYPTSAFSSVVCAAAAQHAATLNWTAATKVLTVSLDGGSAFLTSGAQVPQDIALMTSQTQLLFASASADTTRPAASVVEVVTQQDAAPVNTTQPGASIASVWYAPGLDPRMGDLSKRPRQMKMQRESKGG